jgi:response regulator of citrate/malate metabolism
MEAKITNRDRDLLELIYKFNLLTVSQLAALSQRSRQVIRRRVRFLTDQALVSTRERSYGNHRGRPEDLLYLAKSGWTFLCKNSCSGIQVLPGNKTFDSIFIEHELLVNWVIIHLIQIERNVPQLDVNYVTQHTNLIDHPHHDNVQIQIHVMNKKSEQEPYEFVPDGIFTITHQELKKTLLFFLEVDMGTETIMSPKGPQKDLRQKIINYQTLFHTDRYKHFEKKFRAQLNGFRLLFITNTSARLKALCRLVLEMPPTDFVWLADQESMFSKGLSATIWARGGRHNNPRQSILGRNLATEITVMDKIR